MCNARIYKGHEPFLQGISLETIENLRLDEYILMDPKCNIEIPDNIDLDAIKLNYGIMDHKTIKQFGEIVKSTFI